MNRYIDAEDFAAEVRKISKSPLNEWDTWGVISALERVPTADVAPVVHAHWIEDCGDYKCSHCSTEFWDEIVFIVRTSEHEFPNYCPVCGAKMDEVTK